MATLIQSLRNTLSTIDPLMANETKRILLKEVLQAYTLDFLYNHSTYRKLNFYGGTCLHVVFGINRLSEDIDLDNNSGIDWSSFERDLLTYFRSTVGYVEMSAKTQSGEGGIRRTTLKFPLLFALGLTTHENESLHMKVEISQHRQISILRNTPILVYGRSFVTRHFSLETMMAGKMLACLERNFQKGKHGSAIKGRDFYDLLWFMQQKVIPLEEKLAKDGVRPYSVRSAMLELNKKISHLKKADLAEDLFPLFERRSFIESWLEGFHSNFEEYLKTYL